MNTTEEYYYTIALTAEHHQVAKNFAVQQDTTEKAKQVYLNTLAVFAVEAFLEEISFPLDLEAGDSWNAAIRCFHDVADLLIPNIGKIECRPILPGETKVSLLTEVVEDRIAYVIVQFQEELNSVQLLGYYPTLDPTSPSQEIQINQLEPIENLIDYLFRLELGNDYIDGDTEEAVKVREKLDSKSIPEIVAQFERIYRTEDELDRRFVLADYLRGLTHNKKDSYQPEVVRGLKQELPDDNEEDLTDLAENILDKLSEIWGDDD